MVRGWSKLWGLVGNRSSPDRDLCCTNVEALDDGWIDEECPVLVMVDWGGEGGISRSEFRGAGDERLEGLWMPLQTEYVAGSGAVSVGW